MVKDFRDLDINLINSICNDFETYRDFNILRQIYPYLDYNILYSVLFSIGKYKKELYSKLQQVNIGDKKILLISDTHYGSAHDNMKYAHEVFNFAVANGIHSIFHGGDIISLSYQLGQVAGRGHGMDRRRHDPLLPSGDLQGGIK